MEKKENLKIKRHRGTWYVIDSTIYNGKELYLLESEQYGDEAKCLIVDKDLKLLLADVLNGFDDYYEYLDFVRDNEGEREMRRKLVGINNYTERDTNFMGTQTEIKLHEKVYAVETDAGTIETLREIYTAGSDYIRKSVVTDEDPYKLDFDFVENGEWEEYKR